MSFLRCGLSLLAIPLLATSLTGGRWTIPFGGGAGRITRLGPQPVNIAVNFYGSAVHPSGASSWGMRLQIALLYPQKPRP